MQVGELGQTRRPFKALVLCCAVVFLSKGSYAKLNVFIDADEVSRFLPDLHNSLFLVKNGEVAPMLKRVLLPTLIPPIHPQIRDMRFKFNASTQVKYSLSFRSSNESVMKHPRANIPLQGYVPRKTKGFKITFPCSSKSSGEVLFSIDISFSTKSGRLLWGPLHLSLKRLCSSGEKQVILFLRNSLFRDTILQKKTRRSFLENSILDVCLTLNEKDVNNELLAAKGLPNLLQPTDFPEKSSIAAPRTCNKNCNRKFILRRFCLSDFVIRARIESEVRKHGRRQLRVRVTKKFKQGRVRINKRQLLERRGTEITCDCNDLKPRRSYLIFGKEDKRRRVLYVGDMTTALKWFSSGKDGPTSGKAYVRLHKRKIEERPCPAKILP